jgi:hypothetical protein
VGPRAGLDVCEKSRPNWESIPGPSSPYRRTETCSSVFKNNIVYLVTTVRICGLTLQNLNYNARNGKHKTSRVVSMLQIPSSGV